MASRKEQKEQARARRVAEEREAAARTQRLRRMQLLGGSILVAVIVVAVAIAISAGSSGGTHLITNKHQQTKVYAQVNDLLKGIPQSGVTLGNPSAKVTLDYYGDLECPICQAFTLGSQGGGFPQLVQNDVRQGKVKVVYKSFCTATCNGPGQSVFNNQQVAAYAAGEQHLFWDFAELFYREQGTEGSDYATNAYLHTLASQIPNLNLPKWQADRGNQSLLAQVQADQAHGNQIGVTGTPTVVAIGPKGTQPVGGGGIPTYGDLETAIKQVT